MTGNLIIKSEALEKNSTLEFKILLKRKKDIGKKIAFLSSSHKLEILIHYL